MLGERGMKKTQTGRPAWALVGLAVLLLSSVGGAAAYANALGDPQARGVAGASGDGLSPVEEEVKAGEITVGSASQVVIKFQNASSKDVQVGQINLYPGAKVSVVQAEDEE